MAEEGHRYYFHDQAKVTIIDKENNREITLPLQLINQIAKEAKERRKVRLA